MKRILLIWLTGIVALAAHALEQGQTYRIVSKKFPGKSLFVNNSQRDAGADIVLWTETDVPSQQWKVLYSSATLYALQNVYTGTFAAPKSKTKNTSMFTAVARTNSRFAIEPVDEAATTFRILISDNALALAVATGEDGERPTWQTPDLSDEGQLWEFEVTEPKSTFTPAMRDEMMDAYLKVHLREVGATYRTFNNGGWSEAEQLEILLDAYESTGYERYLTAARRVYSYFVSKVGSDWTKGASGGYDWFGYDFNDDVMWQVIAVARLGWLTGISSYTNAAKANFDRIYKRAYIPFTGMLRWAENTGDRYSTNSCIQGPTEVAACFLGMSGCGEEYFEKARDIYAAQRKHLAQNMATGKIWDCVVWDPATEKVKSRNEWASTYNQGTMLGAACLLYRHYADDQYLSDARKIMSFTKNSLCNTYGIVNVCQDEANGDLWGFKGILMRYVRRFVLELNQSTYKDWTIRNAFMAYCNRSERGITGTAWLTKSTAATTASPFACSTAASAAANTVFGDVMKVGLDTLQAEAFDYHCGLLISDEAGQGGSPFVQVANSYWAQYCNVNFGTETVRSLSIDVTPTKDPVAGTIEIYFDKMEGTPAGVLELKDLDDSQPWHTLVADIAPTTGTHHLYLRFTYANAHAKAFGIDRFCFHTQTAQELLTSVRDCPVPTAFGSSDDTTFYTLSGIRLPQPPRFGTYLLRQAGKTQVLMKQ